MLKNISNLGTTLNKKEKQSINGGLWFSLAECQDNCEGICAIGFLGQRWACFE